MATTVVRGDSAVHGVQLEPNTEAVVEFEVAPASADVVVTAPGSAPVFWTADGQSATVGGADARIIPANVIAVDTARVRPLDGDLYPPRAQVRIISAAAATLSVQRGG